jgi:hypothetical protein
MTLTMPALQFCNTDDTAVVPPRPPICPPYIFDSVSAFPEPSGLRPSRALPAHFIDSLSASPEPSGLRPCRALPAHFILLSTFHFPLSFPHPSPGTQGHSPNARRRSSHLFSFNGRERRARKWRAFGTAGAGRRPPGYLFSVPGSWAGPLARLSALCSLFIGEGGGHGTCRPWPLRPSVSSRPLLSANNQ